MKRNMKVVTYFQKMPSYNDWEQPIAIQHLNLDNAISVKSFKLNF